MKKLVLDSLRVFALSELDNLVMVKNNQIEILLADGTKAKIWAKKVA